MTSVHRFWTRMGHWFKPGDSGDRLNDHDFDTDGDGLIKPVSDQHGGNGSTGGALLRRPAQMTSLQRLEEGYHKLSGLVDSIHRHLEVRDERTRQVADSLIQLSATVGRMTEVARVQQEQLASIARLLETSDGRQARWEQAIAQIPNLVDAQRDNLQSVSAHLGAVQSTHERVAASLTGFGESVGVMRQTLVQSADVMARAQCEAAVREERMTGLFARQGRWFTGVIAAVAVLAAAVIVLNLVVLFVR
ncbi:MAG: hypothetical protein HOP29_01555 [Phycisphaerales bacterium]|nr:hypothetical protein [Phycisphaerales bacterium]